MTRPLTVSTCMIGLLLILTWSLTGCQEVVTETYGPSTGKGARMDYEYRTVHTTRSEPEPSFIERLGDALFDWSDDDAPESRPERRERRYDPIWLSPGSN